MINTKKVFKNYRYWYFNELDIKLNTTKDIFEKISNMLFLILAFIMIVLCIGISKFGFKYLFYCVLFYWIWIFLVKIVLIIYNTIITNKKYCFNI